MGYWIELMCDVNRDGTLPGKPHIAGCITSRGDSPGRRVWTKDGANVAMTDMRRAALKKGWRVTGAGLACPFCAHTSALSQEPTDV